MVDTVIQIPQITEEISNLVSEVVLEEEKQEDTENSHRVSEEEEEECKIEEDILVVKEMINIINMINILIIVVNILEEDLEDSDNVKILNYFFLIFLFFRQI